MDVDTRAVATESGLSLTRAAIGGWLAVAALTATVYLLFSIGSHPGAFGFNQWRHLAPSESLAPVIVLLVAASLTLGAASSLRTGSRVGDELWLAVLAVGAGAVFFALQTHFLNTDGKMFAWRFRDIPATNGAFVTHDELLELYVHSRVWYYTHLWWGWDVPRSYRPVSCGAGAVFFWLLCQFSRRQERGFGVVFIPGMLSGAYMQLFFGEVENYTLIATVMMLYVFAADRFLKKKVRLWWPAMAIAIAMCFHLLAGWTLPALLYLFWIQWQRSRDWFDLKVSAALFLTIGAAVLAYFHFHGLPVTYFISSHAGSALRMVDVWVDKTLPSNYYLQQLSLLFLLCPAVGLGIALLLSKRFVDDELTRFLAIVAGMLLLLQTIWKAQLGVYEDWNLFATGGMCVALLIWRNVTLRATSRPARVVALTLAGLYSLHTYAWIVANHALPPL